MGEDNTSLDYICQFNHLEYQHRNSQRDTCHLFHIFNQAVCILPSFVCVSFILAFCSLYYTLKGHSISFSKDPNRWDINISIYPIYLLINIYCQGFQCQKLGTKTKYVFHIIPHLCKFLVFSGLAQAYSTFLYHCHLLKKCCYSPTTYV